MPLLSFTHLKKMLFVSLHVQNQAHSQKQSEGEALC